MSQIIIDQPIQKKPEFFKNMTAQPTITRTDQNRLVNSTLIPVIKTIKQKVSVNAQFDILEIRHDLGQIREFYGRYRKTGDTKSWTMFPTFSSQSSGSVTVNKITKSSVFVLFGAIPEGKSYDFRLYFIEFGL